jgi:regulatory protein
VVIEGREEPLELSQETLAAFPLREGELLGETDVENLLQAETRQEARSRALRYLETRERSTAELRLRLRRYGYEEQLVEQTLSYLVDLHFVDDGRFAAAYAREKRRAGWGDRRIRAELSRKGVPRPLLAEVLAETGDRAGEEVEGAVADRADDRPEGDPDLTALVERKFGRELRRDRLRAERRVTGFLQRRGHDWERIDQVLRELRAREPTGDD